MTDLRKEKIPVSSLDIGMFVSELDRPWLGTPFLLEGLLIEEEAQINTLASLCEFVYIDRTVSVGPHYQPPFKNSVAIQHQASHVKPQSTAIKNSHLPPPLSEKDRLNSQQLEQRSFFNIVRDFPELSSSSTQVSQHSNHMNFGYLSQDLSTDATPKTGNSANNLSLSKQIKADLSNFVLGLKGWRPAWKVKHRHNSTSLSKDGNSSEASAHNLMDIAVTVPEDKYPIEQEIVTIYPAYEKTQLATLEFFNAMAENQPVDLSKVDEALNEMVDSIERNADALLWLARLKKTDDYSYNHALNVSITLMALAKFMALPKKQIKDLGLAGLLQDIGKVKIPKDLLQKKEKITAEEFEIFKKHVDHALALLEVTDNISSTTMITVSQHHERIDGSGYPYQLSGKQISLTGQMAGLIDTYCALTSNKAYAKSVYNQSALETIHALRDTKFDGRLIDQLVQFLGIYPVSSLVELSSGEVAVVIQQNSVRRLQPKVMVLLNPDKTKNQFPPTLNLINLPLMPNGAPYKIVRGLPPDSYGLNINNYFS